MPCRCDGYEISADDVRREMGQRVEHLEGQLCNARSLIHKLLQHCSVLPNDLRARANEHVALLLEHKKKEHIEEQKALAAEFDLLTRQHQGYIQAAQAKVTEATKLAARAEELKAKIKAMQEATNSDILG